MKKTFKFFMAAAVVAAGFTGCSSEEVNGPKGNGEEGEGTYASVTITESTPQTYGPAGTGGTEGASTAEGINSANAARIKAYVFKDNSIFETKTAAFTYTNPSYTSGATQVTAGTKNIYAFYDVNNYVTDPVTGSSKAALEQTEISAGFAAPAPENGINRVVGVPAGIATNNSFFIGTLWPKAVTVQSGGTATTPLPLQEGSLEIGRLAAKVIITGVTPGTTLKGTFSNYSYRLNSVPKKAYLVGKFDGSGATPTGSLPGTPGSLGHLVTSIVHNDTWYDGSNDDPATAIQNSNYVNYNWTGAKTLTSNAGGVVTNNTSSFYYAVENTTAPDENPGSNGTLNALYYGNTSYVQLKAKYAPHTDEIYDRDGQAGASLIGNDYWAYNYKGNLCIFNEEFNSLSDAVKREIAGDTGSEECHYVDGYMTYSFAIKDPTETGAVKQYRVLRNHSYAMNVTEITQYGSGSDKEIPPYIPIPVETYLKVEITVLPWSKITIPVPL